MSHPHEYSNGTWRLEDDIERNEPLQEKGGITTNLRSTFTASDGTLRPFRLFKQDLGKLFKRYRSDWTTFNQVVIAGSIFIFFANLLPGITFASDLFASTGQNWGTIEIVFSTGMSLGLTPCLWHSC